MTYGPKEYWAELTREQRQAVEAAFRFEPADCTLAEYAWMLAGFSDETTDSERRFWSACEPKS
jgi:hypothetical protein